MEKIYNVWLNNKKNKNSIIIKAFRSSEDALEEKRHQEAVLKQRACALDYDVVVIAQEVF